MKFILILCLCFIGFNIQAQAFKTTTDSLECINKLYELQKDTSYITLAAWKSWILYCECLKKDTVEISTLKVYDITSDDFYRFINGRTTLENYNGYMFIKFKDRIKFIKML